MILNNKKMKRLLILLTLAAGMAMPAQAQDEENEGIRFFHGTWDEALQEAREQGKMLFVDIWASWCGPCKRMAATTFMQKEAGDYFNAHFVNYKLLTDPEDKAERKQARELAQKYHANFLPTLVWVDGDGNLLHFATGYHEVAELIAEARRAQDPARRTGTILQRWADGDRSLEAGMAYFSAFPDASAEFDAFYLGLPPEQQCDTNLQVKMLFGIDLDTASAVPAYIASHWEEQYAKAPRPDWWESVLRRALEDRLELAAGNPEAFRRVADEWRGYNLPFTEVTIDKVLCLEDFAQKDYNAAYAKLATMVEKYGATDLSFVNAVLYALFDQVGEGGLPDGACRPVLMDYAERYAASFEDSEESYANQVRLLACVVCGEKAKAEQYAEAAIRALPDDDMKQESEGYIRYLLSPLEKK